MKTVILALGMLLLSIVLVSADGDHQSEFEEGKKLVDSGMSCDNLTDEQLEAIGEYYMEQMHPGEAHELMDEMMGGEGSENLKQVHIQMAKRLYCNENAGGMMGSGGMMGMMNMMGGGMMGQGTTGWQNPQTNMMQGMMGNWGYGLGYWNFWCIIGLLVWMGIMVLIIWFIYTFIIKREAVPEIPINVLKKRYAKGEINKKQFEEMKKELKE